MIKAMYIVISFVLCLCIIACSVLCLLKFTFFSESFMSDTLNNSGYYSDLCDEITDSLIDIGDASGLDKSFFEGFVDEVLVREDIQEYLDKFYGGEKLEVEAVKFEESLHIALEEYAGKKGIDKSVLSGDGVYYFVDEASRIYRENIEIAYFGSIQGLMVKLSPLLTGGAIASAVLILALACVLLFTNKWKHLGVKYIYYSCCGSALFLLIIPLIVFAGGFINRIAVLTRSLCDMYSACLTSFFVSFLVIGLMLAVISAALIVVHSHIRKKVS